jgi:hypothetical protein
MLAVGASAGAVGWRVLLPSRDVFEDGCRAPCGEDGGWVSLVGDYVGRYARAWHCPWKTAASKSVSHPLGWSKSGARVRAERRSTAFKGSEQDRFMLGCLGFRW